MIGLAYTEHSIWYVEYNSVKYDVCDETGRLYLNDQHPVLFRGADENTRVNFTFVTPSWSGNREKRVCILSKAS